MTPSQRISSIENVARELRLPGLFYSLGNVRRWGLFYADWDCRSGWFGGRYRFGDGTGWRPWWWRCVRWGSSHRTRNECRRRDACGGHCDWIAPQRRNRATWLCSADFAFDESWTIHFPNEPGKRPDWQPEFDRPRWSTGELDIFRLHSERQWAASIWWSTEQSCGIWRGGLSSLCLRSRLLWWRGRRLRRE